MKFEKWILIIIILLAFGWLFYLDFVPGDSFMASYDFCSATSRVTELSPGNRLWPLEKNNNECWQRIGDSPVYFYARTPQKFERAVVTIKFKNPVGQKFQVGPQVVKDEWQWRLQDIAEIKKEGEWSVAILNFDLENIYQNANHMRWLISAPEVLEKKELLAVSEISIRWEKEKLNFSNLGEQIKSYLRKIIR